MLPALEQLLQEGPPAAREMHPSETLSCKSLRYPVQKESEFLFGNNDTIQYNIIDTLIGKHN